MARNGMPELPRRHNPFKRKGIKSERDRKRAADKANADAKRRNDPLRAEYRKKQWRDESAAFLALPGNEYCFCGCGKRANMVHHAKAPRSAATLAEARRLFWDVTNWRPGNRRCNSRYAAKYEGGFGNPVRPAPDPSKQ